MTSPTMTSFRRPWPVLFLCCVLVFNGMGLAFGMGAIFTDMMDAFRVSRATASTVQSLCTGFSLGAGIVTGYLVQWRGPRMAVMAGSVLATAGCITAFLATHIVPVIVGLGVITGFGISFNYLTAITLPGIIFPDRKRRSLAMSFFNVSSAAGSSLYPLFLRHVTNRFSLRGTFMILAAVNCQMILCGALIGFFALRRRVRRSSATAALVKDAQNAARNDDESLVVGEGEDYRQGSVKHSACGDEAVKGDAYAPEPNDASTPGCEASSLVVGEGEDCCRFNIKHLTYGHDIRNGNSPAPIPNRPNMSSGMTGDEERSRNGTCGHGTEACNRTFSSGQVEEVDLCASYAATSEKDSFLGDLTHATAVPIDTAPILRKSDGPLGTPVEESESRQESAVRSKHEPDVCKDHSLPPRLTTCEGNGEQGDLRQSRQRCEDQRYDSACAVQQPEHSPAALSDCQGDDRSKERPRHHSHWTETRNDISDASILQEEITPLRVAAGGDIEIAHQRNTLRRGDEGKTDGASITQLENSSTATNTGEGERHTQRNAGGKARRDNAWTLQLEVLRNSRFVAFVFFGQTSLLFFNQPWMFMTDMVQSNNLTVEDGSSFITLIFVGNLTGRVISGVLYRLLQSGIQVVCSVAVATGGVACLFYAFSTDYAHFVAVSLVFGTSYGLLSATVPMSVVEILGPDRFAVGVSYMTFLEGLSLLLSGPFGGLIRDLTNSYQPLYFIAIVHGLVVGALLLFTTLRYRRRS